MEQPVVRETERTDTGLYSLVCRECRRISYNNEEPFVHWIYTERERETN
jgi:hypothetical protein